MVEGSVIVNDEEEGLSVELMTGQGWSVKVYLDDASAWEMFNVLKDILKSRWGKTEGANDGAEETEGEEGK